MANQYPNEDFQKIYDSIYASMGDDATLKANIEAALKPLYEQSKQQLEEQRIARNADIDVDAASRGMGNSTWVTDAKLRQLRSNASALASLDANYNSQLYNALLGAMQDRDNNAYNQALQMYQIAQQGKGGSGGGSAGSGFWADGTYFPSREAYENYLKKITDNPENGYSPKQPPKKYVPGTATIGRRTDQYGLPIVAPVSPVGTLGQSSSSRNTVNAGNSIGGADKNIRFVG